MRNRGLGRTHESARESTFTLDLPEAKELTLLQGSVLFAGVALVGVGIGIGVASQVFIGTAALLGLVIMSERYPHIKWFIQNTNQVIDLVIFAGSIYAIAALGTTLAGGITITGLGYTLLYAPYVRKQAKRKRGIV